MSVLYPLLALWALKKFSARIPGSAALAVKLYPVGVNICLLGAFSSSLISPPSFVERLARLKVPELSERQVRYARSVTKVWCAFFIFNGSTALATALWARNEVWALYNGVLSYLLMGCLAGAEWLTRRRMLSRSAS